MSLGACEVITVCETEALLSMVAERGLQKFPLHLKSILNVCVLYRKKKKGFPGDDWDINETIIRLSIESSKNSWGGDTLRHVI